MLCQFTVKNYKSFRDEAVFDMQAAAISEHEDRVIRDCILRSRADSDAFQSGRYAEYNGRPKTLNKIA